MTTSVQMKATYNGRPLEVLSSLIKKREQYLKDTTRDAVIATAINVLGSIRARTKVADPNKADFGSAVHPAPGVVAGWKREKGTKVNRRVVRTIGGHEMQGARIVNLAGKYTKGENILCFVVIFKSPSVSKSFKSGYERAYVIAKDAKAVKAWASKRVVRHIKRYRGMAKWAIGQAQRQVHGAANLERDNISARARRVALDNIIVKSTSSGWSSGSFSVYIHDKLDYAALALKGGPADVQMALMKAANRTAGIINHVAGKGFGEKIPTPFPEIKGRR